MSLNPAEDQRDAELSRYRANRLLPRLSEKTLEALLMVALDCELSDGLRVHIPLSWIFSAQFMEQVPQSIRNRLG